VKIARSDIEETMISRRIVIRRKPQSIATTNEHNESKHDSFSKQQRAQTVKMLPLVAPDWP